MIDYSDIIIALKSIRQNDRPRIEEIDYIDTAIDNLRLAKFEKERYREVKSKIIDEITMMTMSENIDNVNLTKLAENICDEYQVDFDGGPLDDETHWIWSLVSHCVDEIKEENNDS